MTEIKLPPLPEGWETELLDWVSACQSAYHIDNTPGHRFGGLGSNLEENRSEIVCFVRGLIESHATALQSQDREDAERYRWLKKQCKKTTGGLVVCRVINWELEPWSCDRLDQDIDRARNDKGDLK